MGQFNRIIGITSKRHKDWRNRRNRKREQREEKNPFKYVGVFIDRKEETTYCERNGNKWVKFSLYPRCSLRFDKKYWTGEVYSFSVELYDWVKDDRYENFAKWVEEAAKKAGR